jgi:hypothetical protein
VVTSPEGDRPTCPVCGERPVRDRADGKAALTCSTRCGYELSARVARETHGHRKPTELRVRSAPLTDREVGGLIESVREETRGRP